MSNDETSELFDSLFSSLKSYNFRHQINQPTEDDRFWLAVQLHDFRYAIDDAELALAHFDLPSQTPLDQLTTLLAARNQHLQSQYAYEKERKREYKGNGVVAVEWLGELPRAGNCMCGVAIQAQREADYRPRWRIEYDAKQKKKRAEKRKQKLALLLTHTCSSSDNDHQT